MKLIVRKLVKLKSKIFGEKINPYWIQELKVSKVNDRMEVFFPFVENKKVLHVGCTDYPIFNKNSNLHLKLKDVCSTLHGMDVDINGIEVLKKYYPGIYYSTLKEVDQKYDTILIPETIEHVENIGSFLKEISAISAKNFIISGPNCFRENFTYSYNKKGEFTERIHPDHNCWFSPYTLRNVIEKYSDLKVDSIYLSNKDLMIICVCSKKVPAIKRN